MRKRHALALIAALAAGLPLCGAGDTPVAETTFGDTFSLDTAGSPRALKTQADIAALRSATYRAGETVTLAAPGGSPTALVTAAAADGTVAIPVTAIGGVWTLANSRQGTSQFTVRRSLDGTLGDGTAASPARLVDGDELADLVSAGTAGSGYVFVLDGADSLLAALVVPSGYCLEEGENGVWRIIASANGSRYAGRFASSFPLDGKQPGPDRRVIRSEVLPVAYSGDNWIGVPSKTASVTFVPPDGDSTTLSLHGTGAVEFSFRKVGRWTVRLVMDDGSVHEALLDIEAECTIFIVR